MPNKVQLPYYGTEEDAQKILGYLRSKPMGATEADIRNALGSKYVDPRKGEFYDLLGLFARSGGNYRITESGLRYGNGTEQAKWHIVRGCLASFKPYLALLDWAFHNDLAKLDSDQAKHFWVQKFGAQIELANAHRLAAAPLTFFVTCAMAGLGTFVLGRRGAKSRLELNRQAVLDFLSVAGKGEPEKVAQDVPADGPKSTELGVEESAPAPIEASGNLNRQGAAGNAHGRYAITIPIFGRLAQLVWVEPTLTVKEWARLKKIGDAMFGEDDENGSDAIGE